MACKYVLNRWAEVSRKQSRIQVAMLESLALAEKWFMCPSAWEPSECFTLYRLVRHWSLEMQTRLWYDQNTPKWWFLVGKPMVVGYHHFRKPPYASICIMLYDWNPKRKHTKTIIISHNFKEQHFVLHPASLRLSFHLGTGRQVGDSKGLKLSPCVLAKIMQGDITTWDHADIKAENPSLNVPAGTQIKADGLWMDVASWRWWLHHTHQTLQGAVEICETAFHTNPMLSSWLQVGHRTLGSSSTTGMTGGNWVNLKHCTRCYAVVKSCLYWSLTWLPKHVSSCRKDTWRPNAQQVGPWAAEAPWPGRRQPRSLDTAPLLCLSQTELPRFTLVQNRLVPDKYDKYVLGQQIGGTVSLWQFGGCNLFECYGLFHWNKNCISAAPLWWISLTSSPSN